MVLNDSICVICGTNKTVQWHYLDKDKNKPICKKCYLKSYYKSNKAKLDENHKNYNLKNRADLLNYWKKRVKFKDKQVILEQNPRKGICKKCSKSVEKNEVKRTSIHHIKYDSTNPLANTIELCNSCHRKEHMIMATNFVN